MYRPRPPQNQSQFLSSRLPKLAAMPTEKELEHAFQEASKRNAPIELPWGAEGSAAYLLTIQPAEEPVWTMYEGDVAHDNPLWRHASRDMGLIHSMIFQSCPEDTAPIPSKQAATPASLISGSQSLMPPDTSKASLQGRLENMQITSLFQSIQMSKMTGRLQIFDQGQVSQVYFDDGNPVHASCPEGIGDQAIIETMTWEHGDFRFFPDEKSTEKTVKRRVESMIMEGITLLDQLKFLQNLGLKPDSFLVRKDTRISPEEFKSRLSNGAPLDLNAQKAMYELCDGRTRWQDLLTRKPLTKLEWVPLLFNLTSCALINIQDNSPFAQASPGATLDRNMIAGVQKALVRAETGLYTYPALLYFLEREFAKCIALGMPLSLIIFETRIVLGGNPQPLPIPALRELASRVEQIKRPFDILAHHETFDFAILLPGTSSKAARLFAHKVSESLVNVPLVQGQTQRLLLAGGIISAPEDTVDIGRFVAGAREAKNKAKEGRIPLRSYSEL